MPTPGEPVMPTTWRVAGVRRQPGHHLAQQRRRVLDQRDQPGDGAGVTRPGPLDESGTGPATCSTRRASMAGCVSRHPTVTGGHADDQGVALAAAAAQRGRTDAAAATLELEREVQHDPGAGHADRVADARSRRR